MSGIRTQHHARLIDRDLDVGVVEICHNHLHIVVQTGCLEFLATELGHKETLVYGTVLTAGVVYTLVGFVDATDINDIVFTRSNLSFQFTIHAVEIDMVVAILLASDNKRLAIGEEFPCFGNLDISVVCLGIERFKDTCRGVGKEQFHAVLQTVHTHKRKNLGILGPLHAWQVLVVLATRIEADGIAVGEIVDIDVDNGVILTSLGIFIVVILRIESTPCLHRELLDVALIKTIVGYTTGVGAPVEALSDGKLLLIDPVGGTIDYIVETTVVSHLMLSLRIQIHIEEVVITHISHLGPIGRQRGESLLTLLRYLGKGAIADLVDIIVRHSAVTIYGFKAGAEQDGLLVRREGVRLDGRQRLCHPCRTRAVEGAYRFHLLASSVAVFLDSCAGQHTIVLTVFHRFYGLYATRSKGAFCPDVFQSDLFCRLRNDAV